ncbi:MAG: membrane associated GTPase, partial [Synechococcus sp.]
MPIPALATKPWLKPALVGSALLGGGLVLGDLLHGGASSLGLLAAASAGLWWIGGRRQLPE